MILTLRSRIFAAGVIAALNLLAFSQTTSVRHSKPRPPSLESQHGDDVAASSISFADVTKAAGIDFYLTCGGTEKRYIMESMCGGVAAFDYDNDGWTDIFLVNGSTVEDLQAGKCHPSKLYRNNRDGTFTDVTAKSGISFCGQTDYPLRFGWAPLRSVRTEGFKLIEAPRPELYNLQNDPGELENKYEPQSPKTQQLRGILAEIPFNSPSPALPDPKDRIEEQNLLHGAMMASEDNRAADARSALEKVLQLDPKSPTALRQLGELELQAGDYARAAHHLKAALEARPDDATAAFYEGQALEKSHDLPGARDALEKSLKLMPGQFQARLLLGQVYLGLKDAKAAEDQFEAALLLQSNSVEAQLGVAKAEILQGSPAEAASQLEVLAKSHPQNLEAFELLSQAYASLGKLTEAHRADVRADQLRRAQK